MTIGIKIAVESTRYGGLGQLVSAYQERVIADGGNVDETQANLVNLLNQLNGVVPDFTNSCKLFVAPHLGNKSATGTGGTAGNRAANKIYNIFGASGDLVQTTAASQPLLLRNIGEVFAFNSGVNGNGFSTPNVADNQLTDNFSIECKINLPDLNVQQIIDSKYGSPTLQQYAFFVNSNTLFLRMYNGTEFNVTSDSIAAFAGTTWWARVSRNSTTGVVKFFTSTNGTTFTQLGIDQTSVTGALNSPIIDRRIGAFRSTFTNALLGQIFYSNIYKDDTFTTVTQMFNPQLYNRSASQTTIPSSTGETYTINTAATNTGLKAMIVDKGLVVGNGSSYGMQASSFNLAGSAFTRYTIFQKYSNTAGSQIINELGANIASGQGLYLAINGSASNEEFGINAGGLNNSRYTSNSLLMKVATSVVNINNADEATPYLIDNSAQSLVAKDSNFNNTSPVNATGLNLLARNNAASLWANAAIFADLIFEGEHDATTRTNVYNILKTYFKL